MGKENDNNRDDGRRTVYIDSQAAELDIVRRALNGDSEAKTAIVIENQQNVYNLGLRLTGNPEKAECLLQETFLKVFEKLESFRGDSRLKTWIHRIATNVALMDMRSRKNKFFMQIDEQTKEEEDDSYDLAYIARSLEKDPLEITMNNELRNELEQAIDNLPDNLRAAFVLKDLEELSMAEIAQRLGKSVSAIKADLHRARVKLRGSLANFLEESAG